MKQHSSKERRWQLIKRMDCLSVWLFRLAVGLLVLVILLQPLMQMDSFRSLLTKENVWEGVQWRN